MTSSSSNVDREQESSLAKAIFLTRVCLLPNGFDWMYPVLLISSTILYEFTSFATMMIIADFYRSITSRDVNLFVYILQKSCIIVIAVSISKSSQQYFSDICSLLWREKIVDFIHYHYFSCIALNLNMKNIQKLRETNPEQRVSQDVDKLTLEFSRVFDKFLVTPVLIAFYTYYLWELLGLWAPLSCYAYFIIGALGSSLLARRMITPMMQQEKYEGEFRLHHSNLSRYLIDINLLGGILREKDILKVSFLRIVTNTKALLRLRLFVNLFLNVHSYAGSIGKIRFLDE